MRPKKKRGPTPNFQNVLRERLTERYANARFGVASAADTAATVASSKAYLAANPLPGPLLFPANTTSIPLKSTVMQLLNSTESYIKAVQGMNGGADNTAGTQMQIVGHQTPDEPAGTALQRAQSVRQWLVNKGLQNVPPATGLSPLAGGIQGVTITDSSVPLAQQKTTGAYIAADGTWQKMTPTIANALVRASTPASITALTAPGPFGIGQVWHWLAGAGGAAAAALI